MEAYASTTGTRVNLEALRIHGWRLMISATGQWKARGFCYGIDNGAWTYHQLGIPWEPDRWVELVESAGCEADFVVAPDIVAGGLDSLRLTKLWLPWMDTRVRLTLIPVQDGMTPDDVRPLLVGHENWRGIFVGGSTEWKVKTLPWWGDLSKELYGVYLHVGRVNSAKRIGLCAEAGADSFDGTSVTRFVKTIYKLDKARKEGCNAKPDV